MSGRAPFSALSVRCFAASRPPTVIQQDLADSTLQAPRQGCSCLIRLAKEFVDRNGWCGFPSRCRSRLKLWRPPQDEAVHGSGVVVANGCLWTTPDPRTQPLSSSYPPAQRAPRSAVPSARRLGRGAPFPCASCAAYGMPRDGFGLPCVAQRDGSRGAGAKMSTKTLSRSRRRPPRWGHDQ